MSDGPSWFAVGAAALGHVRVPLQRARPRGDGARPLQEGGQAGGGAPHAAGAGGRGAARAAALRRRLRGTGAPRPQHSSDYTEETYFRISGRGISGRFSEAFPILYSDAKLAAHQSRRVGVSRPGRIRYFGLKD